VAYSWSQPLAALRYLDARGWHSFGAKVLMPATDFRHPGFGSCMKTDAQRPAAGGAAAPQQESTAFEQLLDGQSPRPPPAPTPRGRCTGSWCWRCAASSPAAAKPCSRGSIRHRSWLAARLTCSPMAPFAAGFRRSIIGCRLRTTWRYWAGCISVLIFGRGKKKR